MRWTGTPASRRSAIAAIESAVSKYRSAQVLRHHLARLQPVDVLADVGVGIERQPVLGLTPGADVVHPPHQHAEPPGPGLVELVGRAPPARSERQ